MGVFPFMKHQMGHCGGASTEVELHVEVKKAWKLAYPKLRKIIRGRVMRNMADVVQLEGGS